jgi:uncharacterized protein (TIGR00369 family)
MSETRSRTYEWEDPMPNAQVAMTMAGLDYMKKMLAGEIPQPPIAKTLGFQLVHVEHGFAIFEGEPQEWHYNPIGVVHGGLAATLLDSALGCCVHTSLPQGVAYTTTQLNVNLVRAITKDTGTIRCEGRVLHGGKQLATAEASIKDMSGKLYAHGTTTCLVFPLK